MFEADGPGGVFGPSTQPPPPLPSAGAPAAQAVLPYATPFGIAPSVPTYAAWRDGAVLITPTVAVLPRQCVKCGQAADGWYGRRKFYWHHPGLLLLILVNLIVFAIVALVVRKTATVELGLCARHIARRRMAIGATWLLVLGGCATLAGGFYVTSAYRGYDFAAFLGTLTALVMWVTAAVVSSNIAAFLRPTRIDSTYAFFKGAGPDFLSLFPPAR
jgi:hypothetical protein